MVESPAAIDKRYDSLEEPLFAFIFGFIIVCSRPVSKKGAVIFIHTIEPPLCHK